MITGYFVLFVVDGSCGLFVLFGCAVGGCFDCVLLLCYYDIGGGLL